MGIHGPTCIFWANLTPFSLKATCSADGDTFTSTAVYADDAPMCGGYDTVSVYQTGSCTETATDDAQVRKTPRWPRSWANSSLF